MASRPEELEARERQLHSWQKDEQDERRDANSIGSVTNTSIADSSQQTSGAREVPGPSAAVGAGLSSLELLKALVGGGEADGCNGKSTGARVSTLSIEAEEAARVPQVEQLLPTTRASHFLGI